MGSDTASAWRLFLVLLEITRPLVINLFRGLKFLFTRLRFKGKCVEKRLLYLDQKQSYALLTSIDSYTSFQSALLSSSLKLFKFCKEKSRDTVYLWGFDFCPLERVHTKVKKWSLISLTITPDNTLFAILFKWIWSIKDLLSFWIWVAFLYTLQVASSKQKV